MAKHSQQTQTIFSSFTPNNINRKSNQDFQIEPLKTPPPTLCIDRLPSEMLDKILSKLETHEQCKLRRVCHKWKDCVEKIFAITRFLKLNLTLPYENFNHEWTPAVSLQSAQFDSNWTEPKLELTKKAKVSVPEQHFSSESANALIRLFSQVHYLVIYFDLEEKQKNFYNLLKMIVNFRYLKSFSLIRSKRLNNPDFLLSLCENIKVNSLKRFELFVEHRSYQKRPVHLKMNPFIGHLEGFAIGFWPSAMNKIDQQAILENIGGSPKNSKLTSLCLPTFSSSLGLLNMAQVFDSNAALHNVKRLQLTEILSIGQVKQSLGQCPKLESLVLYFVRRGSNGIKPNRLIEAINQFEHLSVLKIFNECLAPYEEGQNAPNIRKLTIGMSSFFDKFRRLLYKRKRNVQQNYCTKCWKFRIACEFVRLITLKFPALEELTVLSKEYTNSRESWLKIENMILSNFKEKNRNLKVNIETWHSIYS